MFGTMSQSKRIQFLDNYVNINQKYTPQLHLVVLLFIKNISSQSQNRNQPHTSTQKQLNYSENYDKNQAIYSIIHPLTTFPQNKLENQQTIQTHQNLIPLKIQIIQKPFGMNLKHISIIAALLLLLVHSYQTEGEVLVLKDSDFPKVLRDHPYILIEFYAPWCGHCKQLAPQYGEAAALLKKSGSQIKLAKVDATAQKLMASQYGVRGYPTLFFFKNGNKITYTGARNKTGIIQWTTKKSLPSVTQLPAELSFKALSDKSQVSIVLFSKNAASIKQFQTLAFADDYNSYYVATQDLLKKQKEGTVKIIRNFDKQAVYTGNLKNLGSWIAKNCRPTLLPFDQRTIDSIWKQHKIAVVLINPQNKPQLRQTLEKQAKSHIGDLIFSQIDKPNEDSKRILEFIKMKSTEAKVVIIDAKNKKKYVDSVVATAKSIQEYIKSFLTGDPKQYGLTDEIEQQNKNASGEL